MTRDEVRARFRQVVTRGIARANREQRAALDRLRPTRRQTRTERTRIHSVITRYGP